MRRILPIVFLWFFSASQAQDFSNKGKDFWVGYGYHHGMITGNDQDMILYFTSDVTANVKVEIPALGWVKNYQVNANSVAESDIIPKSGSQDARLLTEGIHSAGIHITSDNPIVAYAHIYNSSVSGATLLFPVNTLGQDYYSLNFTQRSNAENSNSWAYVVATDDNTAVEITPSANTLTHTAGLPFVVTLNKGQIYNLMGITNQLNGVDLTGTRIRSVSAGAAGCKKIAVFSGAGRLLINCSNTVTTSDNIIQQVFPKNAWGRKYLTVPTSKLPNNYFRIAVSDPSTIVKIDGVTAANLVNGFYYEIAATTPKSIISDKPVMVSQYITSTNDANGASCGNSFNGNGDPEMIYLSPIEQTIDRITLNSTNRYSISFHFINVVIKTSSVNSFTIDGISSVSSFVSHPRDPAYSYAVFPVAQGAHNLKADSGFNAIAYGYGLTESYGYNAGTNIKDLNQFISLETQYSTFSSSSTCSNTPFVFNITLPYQPTSLVWDFGNNPKLSPNQPITRNNPVADSMYARDGRNLYVYKLPSIYRFTDVGTYTVKILAGNPSGDGCDGQQELSYDLNVSPAPVADFTFTHSGCAADTALFYDASIENGKQLIKWNWDFGDGIIDSVKNPRKVFSGANTYNVKLTAINEIGCSADTTKPFTIAPQPVAKFGFSSSACANMAVTFTDSSSIATGSIKRWYWNLGNGQVIVNDTNFPVEGLYTTEGTYSVSLQVENNSGCRSTVYVQTVTIHPQPLVNFDMPGACLPNAVARFTNLSAINDGSGNSLTWSWNFGDSTTSVDKDPVHTYTKAGPFTVQLTAKSVFGCVNNFSKVFSNIYTQPSAAFINDPAKICFGDSVRFSDNSAAPNSSVNTWFWNFGDGGISNDQNPVTKYAGTGSYPVSLYISSAAGCPSDTVTKTIFINAVPTAAFAVSSAACENKPVTITDQSLSNSGVIINWNWDFGNGTTATYQNGNPFTILQNGSGTYTVRLIVETDTGCESDTTEQSYTIKPNPITNFVLPEICIADAFASFTDSTNVPGNGGGSLTYVWNFGDPNATSTNPNTSNVQNPQHKYTVAGDYTVSLAATSAEGCTSPLSKIFTVNGFPQASFIVADSSKLCSNAAVSIRNTSSANIGTITRIEITWDLQNFPATIVAEENPLPGNIYTHVYPASSISRNYQIKFRAFTGESCADEKVVTIKVNPSPDAVFSSVPAICANDRVFTISQARETTGISGTSAYTGSGISSSGLFNPAAVTAGDYFITYSYTTADGCIDSAVQSITVLPAPSISLSPQIKILEGGSALLNPIVVGDIANYNWTPGIYLDNANIRNPRTSPPANQTYRLTVTTDRGCSVYDDVSVILLLSLEIPNAFSPNGDGINDKWIIPSLESYPGCTVDVFNRYGKIVFSSVGYDRPWTGTFNGNNLPVGVYYYIVNPKNGRNVSKGSVTILR